MDKKNRLNTVLGLEARLFCRCLKLSEQTSTVHTLAECKTEEKPPPPPPPLFFRCLKLSEQTSTVHTLAECKTEEKPPPPPYYSAGGVFSSVLHSAKVCAVEVCSLSFRHLQNSRGGGGASPPSCILQKCVQLKSVHSASDTPPPFI